MKTLKYVAGVTLFVAVFVSLGTISVGAAAPNPGGVPTALHLDNLKRNIPANSAQWYHFDYQLHEKAQRPTVELTLVNGTWIGGFEVWTADQLAQLATTYQEAKDDPVHNQPIGRGTARRINCDTYKLDNHGDCKADDLTWRGTFGASGSYYVLVTNTTNAPVDFALIMRHIAP